MRERLAPGGVVLVNVGHPAGSDRLEQVLTATMGAELPTVLRDPVKDTNVALLGTAGRASADRLRAAVSSLPADLRPVADAAAGRLRPGVGGGSVYTDDRAPVEWLVDTSILQVAAHGER